MFKTALLLLALVGAASAQSFVVSFDDTSLIASPTVADVVAAATLINVSNHNIDLLAHRVSNVGDTTWTTSICMSVCQSPGVDTAGTYGIPPGGSQVFLLHFTTTAVPSHGDVSMEWLDLADTSYHARGNFHLTTGGASQFVWPTANMKLYFGQPDTLRWSTPLTGTAALGYSTNGGDSWNDIDTAVALANGQYVWTPDPTFINTAKLRLHVGAVSLVSDLVSVTARFFNPVATATLRAGVPDTVQWTPGVLGTAEFDYSENGQSWTRVSASVNMYAGQYVWTPRDTMNSSTVRVRLRSNAWSFSSDPFTVQPLSGVSARASFPVAPTIVPNPAATTFIVSAGDVPIEHVSVVDMLGREMKWRQEIGSTSEQFFIPRAPDGQYFVRLTSGNHIAVLPLEVVR